MSFFSFFFFFPATVGSDPADITYLYESPPGYVLLGLRLYGLIWFLRAILITRVKYARKRGFYWKFAVLGSLWFIALPLQVGVAVVVIPVHKRPRFVFAFSIVVNMLFFLAMFFLFSPSRFNRAFPFHAKTSDMEARAPASTRSSGGESGTTAGTGRPMPPRQQRITGGGGGGGSVEMTSNGPIFRNRPVAGAGGVSNTNARNNGFTGRSALSGGLALGTPEDRARVSIQKIRSKITQLVDHSDDLEYALDEMNLHDWDSPNVKDSDYDLPNSRGDGGGSGGGGGGGGGSGGNSNRGRMAGDSSGNGAGLSSGGSSSSHGGGGDATGNNKNKKGKSKRPRPPPME